MRELIELSQEDLEKFGRVQIREMILALEKRMSLMDGVYKDDSDLCPLKHSFAPGIYIREIFIPKGTVIVGKIHRHDHPNFLMSGSVTVITEYNGKEHIQAPKSMISKAGTKRVVIAHEDTVWITVHENADGLQEIAKLEDYIIAKSYEELESPRKELKL